MARDYLEQQALGSADIIKLKQKWLESPRSGTINLPVLSPTEHPPLISLWRHMYLCYCSVPLKPRKQLISLCSVYHSVSTVVSGHHFDSIKPLTLKYCNHLMTI